MDRTSARLLLALTGALALTACAGTSTTAGSTPSTSSIATPSTAPSAGVPSPPPTGPSVDQTIQIGFAGGKVSGVPTRVKVKLGSQVALVVTSDVADEVHFHGYDKHADVTRGGTVTIAFQASIPGVFEVELEKLRHRLVLLQVQ